MNLGAYSKMEGNMSAEILIISALAALVISFFVIGAFTPSQWSSRRSILIHRSPGEIFAIINSPRKWLNWASRYPEKGYSPTARFEYEGPESGVGATQNWEMDGLKGNLIITASQPDEGIRFLMQLDGGHYETTGEIDLVAHENGTEVNWREFHRKSLSPLRHLKLRRKGLEMEPDYEHGLARLKAMLEEPANQSQPIRT